MINLEILSEEKILTLKNNKNEVREQMIESIDNSWLKDFFKDANPFNKSKVFYSEFKLVLSDEKDDCAQADLQNAILLHKNLNLNESQACDERVWISLCFGYFYNYMQSRWNVKRKTNLEEHWFIPHGQKRGLYFNGIARLYWFAKLSYDDNLDDPYELTRFCFSNDLGMLSQMIYRGYSNSKVVRMAILKAIKCFVDDGGEYNRNLLYKILKYVSFLGGAYILDSFSEQELKEKIYLKLIDFFIEENPDQKIFKL